MPWLCEMLTLRKSWIKVIRELSLQSFKSSVKSKIISPDFFLRAKLRLYQQQSRALTHHRLETSLINHTHAYKPIMFIESFSINVLGPIMDQALRGLQEQMKDTCSFSCQRGWWVLLFMSRGRLRKFEFAIMRLVWGLIQESLWIILKFWLSSRWMCIGKTNIL